jgi:[ribosomal protein S18]-alanine N-acetyltransferase
MTMVLRYMTLADVKEVAAVDKVSFSTPWPASSYAYEVSESPYSHMVVLEDIAGEIGQRPPASPRWKNLAKRLAGQPASAQRQLLSYGGVWKIMDEAHISTIATHPDQRGNKYGEIALVAMLRRAIVLNAEYVVLEVRVGNVVAHNLYRKYGFESVFTKRNYYSNGEDAYDMRLDLSEENLARVSQGYATLIMNRNVIDQFTETSPPG